MVEYELGFLPWTIAEPNGEIWSTLKSKTVKDIKKKFHLLSVYMKILL